jgi:hypothetical protein
MVETAQLTEILKSKLGITDSMMGGGFGFPGGGAAAGGGGQAAAAQAEEPKKEKTEFTVKLESFNAADKLKVGSQTSINVVFVFCQLWSMHRGCPYSETLCTIHYLKTKNAL